MDKAELTKLIRKYNNGIDGISDDLVKTIEKYQREYEKALYKMPFDLNKGSLKATQANYSKAMSIDAFNKLGFKQLGIDYIGEYNKVAKDRFDFVNALGIETDLGFKDIEILKRLKELDLGAMYGQGEALDNAIKKSIVNAIALEANYSDSVESIAKDLLGQGEKLGTLARYADTYLRTSLFALSRSVDQEIYKSVGGFDKWLYVGPIDNKTRPFCLEKVGGVYTTEEIDKWPIEDGSGLDPWVYGAGWNCRHVLVGYIE